jgi:hypothetical protein
MKSTLFLFSLLPSLAIASCGNKTLPLSSTLPNVMVIGDSISMAVPYTPGGYGIEIQEALQGVAYVQHSGGWFAGGQASNTPNQLACTNASTPGNWLEFTGTFDVITYNSGLHDLVNCNYTAECKEHVPVDVYAQNVVTVLSRLAPRTKRLIFVATTPVPDVIMALNRSYELAVDYNNAAQIAIRSSNIPGVVFLDLWAAIVNYCGPYYKSCDLQRPNDVHFEPSERVFMATLLASAVKNALSA